MRYDQSALHLMKTIPGCEILATVFKQNRLLPADGVSITTSEQVAGIKSHATDPNCEGGQHRMKNGEMSMSDIDRGRASAATDEDEETGKHLKRNGVGAGVVKTMSMSDRGALGGKESAATDEDEETGVHLKRNGVGAGVVKTMSMSDRGLESAATDEGEETGAHLKRNGVGAGVVKTMSMSDRGALGGEESAGKPKTGGNESKIIVLHLEDETYYSRTDAPMLEKMVELKVFNKVRNAQDNIPRLKEYGQKVGKFQLKPGAKGKQRKNFVKYRGACSRDMPTDLNVWMSVGEIPEGDATELKKQSKRKRADDEGK